MKLSTTAGVVAAANIKRAHPNYQVGSIPIVERIILTMQRGGIFPIAVVTSDYDRELQYRLQHYGVIFLKHPKPENSELFSSFTLGMEFFKNTNEYVISTPVNTPMFSSETVRKLIDSSNGKISVPSFNGKCGHPILIPSSYIDSLASYKGPDGLKGAIKSVCSVNEVEVNDAGILLSTHRKDDMEKFNQNRFRYLVSPHVPLSLQRELVFFDLRLKLLLFLIDKTHAVSTASSLMRLSPSKAWELLNTFELETGFALVERKQGGAGGGRTALTEKGYEFFYSYLEFEKSVKNSTEDAFFDNLSKYF
ncbi:MAG: NTP transferase domain-containing protein [Sphaerochaetaceae bacterium]|nr:NTP transferase domain-containing protein [Sphaerochaetaceae bacterium]